MARPDATGAWYRGWRLTAADGSCMDVADEAANAEFFGYPGASRGQSAFPQARVLGLVECGTHAVLAASIAPGAMVSESVQSSWPLVVSCGTKQSHTRLGCSVRARLVAVSRLAVGHPQGLALTQPHAVKRSPKGCRPETFRPATLPAEGDSLPFRWREGRGIGGRRQAQV